MVNRKLFVGPNVKIIGAKGSTSSSSMANRNKSYKGIPLTNKQASRVQQMKANRLPVAAIDSFIDSIRPGYKQEFINYGADKVQQYFQDNGPKFITKLPIKVDFPNGPFTVAFPEIGKSGSQNESYALSKAPNPRPVRLNSTVHPNTYSNDYMLATENACSPLHISGVTLQIPSSATNPISDYFKNTICFDIQTRAQANIAFDLDIANQFSSTQLLTAFNAGIYALQVYYYYSSILSYESDPRNKNEGMIALRNGITAQQISDLSQLGRRLEDTPMPPRVVNWVKYMNMNFLSGDNQGSPIIKTTHNPRAIASTSIQTTNIASALAGIAGTANNTVFTLLRKAIPQWRIGVLYDVSPVPVYDPQFCTIFANLPSGFKPGASDIVSKSVGNSVTATVGYNTYSNKLDGVAYAMCSVHNGTEWLPGLTSLGFGLGSFVPDSRLSYYRVAGVPGFIGATTNAFLRLSRNETSSFDASNVETQVHLSAAEKCQNVCSASLSQTAQNTLDFLFDINTIPVRGQLSSFSRSAKI
jgi:hypothetical protein